MPKGWIGKPSPRSRHVHGRGWLAEMDRAFSDETGEYAVMVRTIETSWGTVEHAAIRNRASTDIPWGEKQRIKDEIFGPERTAIEVFPTENELVYGANMYHLWVLPIGMKLPFSIREAMNRAQ